MENINAPMLSAALLLITAQLISCSGGSSSSDDGGDPLVSMVTVGKKLFFDENLSSEGNQSCASCHSPAKGFADPRVSKTAPVSEGSVSGAFGDRNAPTSAYTSFIPDFMQTVMQTADNTTSNFQGGQFLDGRSATLIEQAKQPFLNPAEMNNVDEADVVSKVENSTYADEFRQVFGESVFSDVDTAYSNIAEAIAAFESSAEMNAFSSKFDAVRAGQVSFTASEQRGQDLFTGTEAKCANCHTINDSSGDPTVFFDFNYYNIATPVNTSNPAYIADSNFRDGGLGNNAAVISPALQTSEQGKFRTPTLRNVELTAPYMHNGTYGTLEEVVEHYDSIVANYDGFFTGYEPEVMNEIANELNFDLNTYDVLGLSVQDKTDLVNFMKTLTDGYAP